MFDLDKQKLHFDYFHNHRWVNSIKDRHNLAGYLRYWQIMAEKIQLAFSLVVARIEKDSYGFEPAAAEVKKYNDLFRQDVEYLIKGKELDQVEKECIEARIEQNFQIVRCAILFRNIGTKYGPDYLYGLLEGCKETFANKLQEVIHRDRRRRIKAKSMKADHVIEVKRRGGKYVVRFFNCPIFGVFRFLALEDLTKNFCVLCNAHGKKSVQARIPFKFAFCQTDCLSGGDNFCGIEICIQSKFLRALMQFLPSLR